MAVVVTGNCRLCRFTECVDVCPAACFHVDDCQVYVDPVECIDCLACIVVCPVNAIYKEMDVPASQQEWIDLNRVRSAELPVLTLKLPPLPSAQQRRAELGL